MATYVTNFARSGDPNGKSVLAWPIFTTESERVLYVDNTVTIGGVPNLDGLRRLDQRYMSLRRTTT